MKKKQQKRKRRDREFGDQAAVRKPNQRKKRDLWKISFLRKRKKRTLPGL